VSHCNPTKFQHFNWTELPAVSQIREIHVTHSLSVGSGGITSINDQQPHTTCMITTYSTDCLHFKRFWVSIFASWLWPELNLLPCGRPGNLGRTIWLISIGDTDVKGRIMVLYANCSYWWVLSCHRLTGMTEGSENTESENRPLYQMSFDYVTHLFWNGDWNIQR